MPLAASPCTLSHMKPTSCSSPTLYRTAETAAGKEFCLLGPVAKTFITEPANGYGGGVRPAQVTTDWRDRSRLSTKEDTGRAKCLLSVRGIGHFGIATAN